MLETIHELILTYYLVDQELSAKIESELQLERDMNDSDELPPNIQDFLENSPFKVFYSATVSFCPS